MNLKDVFLICILALMAPVDTVEETSCMTVNDNSLIMRVANF